MLTLPVCVCIQEQVAGAGIPLLQKPACCVVHFLDVVVDTLGPESMCMCVLVGVCVREEWLVGGWEAGSQGRAAWLASTWPPHCQDRVG